MISTSGSPKSRNIFSKGAKDRTSGNYTVLPEQNKELLTRIEGWLDDEGIPFDTVPDINSRFHLRAQMKNLQVHLRESNVRVGCIVVEGIMSLDQDQIELMKKIKDDEQHSIFLELFRKLDKEEYLFQLSKNFFDSTWLKIQRILYAEDLTRSDLLNEMKELNIKFVNINYELNEAIDNMTEPPFPADSSLYS